MIARRLKRARLREADWQAIIEEQLRKSIDDGSIPGRSLPRVLERVRKWTNEVSVRGSITTQRNNGDPIRKALRRLIARIPPEEAAVLAKSIEEACILWIGLEIDLGQPTAIATLTSRLKSRGSDAFLGHLLSLHLFNVVWLNSCEELRRKTPDEDTLVHWMNAIERMCRQSVANAWRATPSKRSRRDIERVIDAAIRQLSRFRFQTRP